MSNTDCEWDGEGHCRNNYCRVHGSPEYPTLTVCAFCGEKDFDLIGLKNHLENHCDKFRETPGV